MGYGINLSAIFYGNIPSVLHKSKYRRPAVYICGAVLSALSIFVAGKWYMMGGKALQFDLPYREVFDKIILVGDFLLMFLVIYLSVKHHKTIISLLSIVQTFMVAGLELFGPRISESYCIRIDWLTFIMILIIGIIGVAIGIYALGYMHGYHIHHHKELKDRRSFFMAMIFIFYGAMFGLVCSMSLIWLYFFWEVTSVCSFLLTINCKNSPSSVGGEMNCKKIKRTLVLAWKMCYNIFSRKQKEG